MQWCKVVAFDPRGAPQLKLHGEGLRLARPCGRRRIGSCRTRAIPTLNSPKSQEQWQESQGKLMALGLTAEEADKVLGKASGYAKSPYWGESRAPIVPPPEDVQSTLDFLQQAVGLSAAEVSQVLNKFPELLGCSLDEEVKTNVGVLDAAWGITGKTLKALILRKPQVLGYNVDCKGDCMAECTRCWARF